MCDADVKEYTCFVWMGSLKGLKNKSESLSKSEYKTARMNGFELETWKNVYYKWR